MAKKNGTTKSGNAAAGEQPSTDPNHPNDPNAPGAGTAGDQADDKSN